MKPKFFFIALLMTIASSSFSQQTTIWDKWKWLIGDWVGEGNGEPGKGQGWFSLKEDLSGKVLIRKNHSEYPAANGRPANIHDDLMIVYPDANNDPSRATYFDNEGHKIEYFISFSDKTITLLSGKMPNTPVFRLTYTSIDDNTVEIKFEMSQDGEKFVTYTTGRCKRKS